MYTKRFAQQKNDIDNGDSSCVSAGQTRNYHTVIRPLSGWRAPEYRELWQYRDLFYFLIWKNIKGLYAQSILGIGWAVVRPVFSMIVFTVVFGKLAKISSDGAPYAIFNYTALVPWTFFSASISGAGTSLLSSGGLLTKVYVPRIIIPLSQVLSKLVDLAIAFILLFFMMLWFHIFPNICIFFLPVLVMIMIFSATGIGMFLTVLTIQYRDVKHAMGFMVQLLMYACPVVYPTSLIPSQYRLIYGINPMVGVIEGFRSALLGTIPMPWDLIGIGGVMSVFLLLGGALFLGRREHILADVL